MVQKEFSLLVNFTEIYMSIYLRLLDTGGLYLYLTVN